jgi:Organic radical activating enzymes
MKICEHFKSLQGEGIMMGVPTYFIRTVGCNLSCEWCDTKYSYEGGEETSLEEIVSLVGDTENICITGGEPLLNPEMPELLEMLLEKKKYIVVETNGSMDISVIPASDRIVVSMDIKCPSSGMMDKMRFANIPLLKEKDQLKFIIGDVEDLEYASKIVDLNPTKANIIFTPVGGMNLKPLAEGVLRRNINARVLPQLHKIIWGNQRAV